MQFVEEISANRHEYQLSNFQKVLYLALATVFLSGAGFFLKLAVNPIGRDFALVFGIVLSIPGLVLILLAVRSRLILDENQIEVRSALRTYTATRSEIEGLRKGKNQYGSWTRIYLKESLGSFNVSDSFTGNNTLNEWFKGIPNLDELDATAITNQISIQESLGTTAQERLNSLKKARMLAVGLSVATGFAILVPLVSYTPLRTVSLVLCAILPPAAILLIYRFPLLFTVFKQKLDPRIDVGTALFLPAIGMILAAKPGNDPIHLVNFFQLIYLILLALACYVLSLFRIAWKSSSRWGALLGLLIFGGMYSIGLVNSLNSIPDRSAPRVYRAEILKMFETHGKNAGFSLRLAPWGPMPYWDNVNVPKRVYQSFKVGDTVCVSLHSGFLHAPWYAVVPCPEN